MSKPLTRWKYFTSKLAIWVVLNIACKINPVAILSMCLDTANHYHDNIEAAETND